MDASVALDVDPVRACWELGHLEFLLRPHQAPVYRDIKSTLWGDGGYLVPSGKQRRYLLKCHRRFGKSFTCAVLTNELALKKENARMHWAAETAKQVAEIINPSMGRVIRSAPPGLAPEWKKGDGKWVWPSTGAELLIAGCEDERKADRLRGDGTDFFIIDEGGSIDCLHYVYKSIALWMAADRAGRILIPSSPAKRAAHPFTAYCHLAESGQGGYSKRTVYDSKWPEHLIQELADECGGMNTAEWKREGLAEDVADSERQVVPEFTEYEHSIVVGFGSVANDNAKPWRRPAPIPDHCDRYVVMDSGFQRDLTFVLLAYYDFRRAKLVVEDEIVLEHARTDILAEALRAKAEERWGPGSLNDSVTLICDAEPRLVADLSIMHELHFGQTPKLPGYKEAAINEARMWLAGGRVEIHERCTSLRAHLKAGVWNKQRTSYERIEGFGHFDGVDTLVYLVKGVDQDHNPFPGVDPYANPNMRVRQRPEDRPDEGWDGMFG